MSLMCDVENMAICVKDAAFETFARDFIRGGSRIFIGRGPPGPGAALFYGHRGGMVQRGGILTHPKIRLFPYISVTL